MKIRLKVNTGYSASIRAEIEPFVPVSAKACLMGKGFTARESTCLKILDC